MISKQLRYQHAHKQLGLCVYDSRPAIPNTLYCTICAERLNLKLTTVLRRAEWAKVDWTMDNEDIASILDVTKEAVRYQRLKSVMK